MYMTREILIEYFVILPLYVVTLQYVYDLDDKYAACLGVNPLSFNLVSGIFAQILFFRLKLLPDLVQNLVAAKEVVNS